MADIWLGETILALWVLALLEKKYIIKQNARSDGFLSYIAHFCLLYNELAVQYPFFNFLGICYNNQVHFSHIDAHHLLLLKKNKEKRLAQSAYVPNT